MYIVQVPLLCLKVDCLLPPGASDSPGFSEIENKLYTLWYKVENNKIILNSSINKIKEVKNTKMSNFILPYNIIIHYQV